jgi:hypothetical protein
VLVSRDGGNKSLWRRFELAMTTAALLRSRLQQTNRPKSAPNHYDVTVTPSQSESTKCRR